MSVLGESNLCQQLQNKLGFIIVDAGKMPRPLSFDDLPRKHRARTAGSIRLLPPDNYLLRLRPTSFAVDSNTVQNDQIQKVLDEIGFNHDELKKLCRCPMGPALATCLFYIHRLEKMVNRQARRNFICTYLENAKARMEFLRPTWNGLWNSWEKMSIDRRGPLLRALRNSLQEGDAADQCLESFLDYLHETWHVPV